MIVRLKARFERAAKRGIITFQFYDSPIKSARRAEKRMVMSSFQFYDSPIKRTFDLVAPYNERGFNSMIVRLKAKKNIDLKAYIKGFNSMIVRLKEYLRRDCGDSCFLVSIL